MRKCGLKGGEGGPVADLVSLIQIQRTVGYAGSNVPNFL